MDPWVIIIAQNSACLNPKPTCPNPFLINFLVCRQTDAVYGGCANATARNHRHEPQRCPNFGSLIGGAVSSHGTPSSE